MSSNLRLKPLYFWLTCQILFNLLGWVTAEGSVQTGLNQPLYEYNFSSGLLSNSTHPLYIILPNASSVVNVSLCAEAFSGTNRDDIYFEIWATTQINGKYTASGSSAIYTSPVLLDGVTEAAACTFTASTTSLNPPASYRWAPSDSGRGAGVYQIRLHNNNNDTFRRFDVSVTPNKSTNPNPSIAAGRLFAYNWSFDAGNYTLATATDANYYILVPGGYSNTNYVWQLDLQSFAGFVYDIIANSLGVIQTSSGKNIGYSVPFAGHTLSELYPIYLGYPVNAQPEPLSPPSISNYRFLDSAGIDQTISPGSTASIQDSGTFSFNSNVPGTAQIIIDANQDGIFGNTVFGVDDIYIYELVTAGNNSIIWDGRDNAGNILPDGSYDAQLQVRIGEYHFVAGDAETSGGGNNNGLTIYKANSSTSLTGTPVFWDDLTGFDPDVSGNGGSNLPSGVMSVVGSSSGPFRHTWGSFTGNSFGNQTWVDTYTYGLSSFATTPAVIETITPDSPSNLGIAKQASVLANTISIDFYLENFSGVTISSLSLNDDLNTVFGAGNYSVVSTSVITSSPGSSLNLNPSYNGSTVTNMLNNSSTLAAFGQAHIRLVVSLNSITDQGFGPGNYFNSAIIAGLGPGNVSVSDTSTDSNDPDSDSVNSTGSSPDGGNGSNDNNNLATDNTNPTLISLNAYDYGDAPDTGAGTGNGNYQTLRSDAGARHILGNNIYLGTGVSIDSNGFVDGIDNSGNASDDNDDGVSLNGSSLQGQTLNLETPYSLDISTTGTGVLNAWFDWNRDGDFLDSGEQIASNLSPSAGSISLTISVPSNASIGTTYARFRYSTVTGLGPTGDAADGEVEDYQITLASIYDYGDAPDTAPGSSTGNYQTLQSDGGAFHRVNPQLKLGIVTDTEDGSLQNGLANADDGNNSDDEDAILALPTLFSNTSSYNISVSVTNTSTSPAYLIGWIDQNKDGDFNDSGERSNILTIAGGTSNASRNLSWSGLSGLSAGHTYLRIRLSSNPTFGSSPSPVGDGGEGEVEDYRLNIVTASTGFCATGQTSFRYTSSDTPLGVGASPSSINSVINVTDNFFIADVNILNMNGTHAWIGDLVFSLSSPSGTSISLMTQIGGANNSNNDFALSFNSESSRLYSNIPTTPTTGLDYRPLGNLANLNGQTSQGNWTLTVTDVFPSADNGQLNAWTLELCAAPFDYGDAPGSYGDAGHAIYGSATYYLGNNAPDSESFSLNAVNGSSDGNGDDSTATDDEDGVSFGNLTAGQTSSLSLSVHGNLGYLNAWIDWNKDGDFNDSGEQVATNLQDNGSGDNNAASGTIGLSLNVPGNVTTGTSYGRFRWSSTPGLSATGLTSNGEVEDYPLNFLGSADLSISKTIDTSLTGIIHDADNSGNVTPGDTIQFNLIVSNEHANSSNITVSDVLAPGYTYVPGSISGGDFRNDSNPSTTGLNWSISSMSFPSSLTLSFQALVLETSNPADYQNTATVSATTPDSDPSNNSSSVTPDILRIVKYVCNESLQLDNVCDVGSPNASDPNDDFEFSVNGSPGETLVYRIEFHNFATEVLNFNFSDDVPVFTELLEDAFAPNAEVSVHCHANAVNSLALLDLGLVNTITANITHPSVCDGSILPGQSGAVIFKARIK